MSRNLRYTEEQWTEQSAKRARWQRGGEIVNTDQRASSPPPVRGLSVREGVDARTDGTSVGFDAPAPSNTGPLTLPWPPSGNTAVRHAQGVHYLRPEVIAYRDSVAALCARFAPITGRYRLHVHLSPPDARRRDADNALKSLLDALVKAGYVQDDSLNFMRELVVTTDDEHRGRVIVRALAMEPA